MMKSQATQYDKYTCVHTMYNAPAHTSHVAMVAVHQCGFELLSRPPCFANIAPSNFQQSRYLKESLCGRAFENDEAIIMAINERIEEQDQNFFCEGVKHCSKMGKVC